MIIDHVILLSYDILVSNDIAGPDLDDARGDKHASTPPSTIINQVWINIICEKPQRGQPSARPLTRKRERKKAKQTLSQKTKKEYTIA